MCAPQCRACTSAIVGANRSKSGKTLLWKHRDTSATRNFISRASGEKYDFVALFNAGDSLLREAWVGTNEVGFAVMNTQSYNLAPDTAAIADREGIIMARALGICRNLSDFRNLLDTLPKPLGVRANFGVMDAEGNAAWFETDDHGYRVFNVHPDSVAIRTNFSCSGRCGYGLGRERYAAATALISGVDKICPRFLTDTVSCSFYPDRGRHTYVDNGQYIPRRSTSASIVIEQGGTLFVKPGYPPASPSTFVVTAEAIPTELSPDPALGWNSPAWLEVEKRRDALFRKNSKGKRIVRFKNAQTK